MTSEEQAQVDAIIADALVMHKGSLKAYKDGELVEMSVAPVEVDMEMFVPLAFVAEMFETELNVTPNGDTVREIDGTVYVKAAYVAELLSKPYFVHNGLVVIGKDNTSFAAADARVQDEVIRMVRYQRVTRTNIYNDMVENLDEYQHPRLYATADDFARVRAAIETDTFVKKCYENLKMQADALLDAAVATGDMTKANSAFANTSPDRIKVLSFVYQITKDESYAERAWEELEAVCTAGTWPTSHFLTIGKIMAGVSIGFDWLYDYLDDEQKELIKDKLYTDGIYEAYLTYIGTPTNTTHGWTVSPQNWNPHINSSNLASMIAIYDEEFDGNELEDVIIPSFEMALRSLEIHFNEWDPDGAWEEGPGYGRDTVMFDAKILSLLNTAMGTDYGIAEATNFLGSAYYMFYMQGPAGDYNYGNADQLVNPANKYSFYYAKVYEDKSIGYERKTTIEAEQYACDALELIWYDPLWIGDKIEGLELDKYFRRSEVVTMRSDWSKDGMFAGFLSGYNAQYVSHLDTGNYVLDWAGTRWADDLGSDSLNTNYAGGAIRSYAERAEGHNTLVIDETPYLNGDIEKEFVASVEYDFEDVEIGTAPEVTGSFKWKKRLDTSSVEVVADPKDADNQVLKLNKAEMDLMLTPAATEVVELNYKIMVGAATNQTQLGNIKVFSSSSGTAGSEFQTIRINNPDGSNGIWYYNSQSAQNDWVGYEKLMSGENPVEFTYGEWYDISLRMDVANGTYDLCINDTTVEDLLMPRGEIRNFKFNFNWFGDVDVYFDDMTVKFPSDLVTSAKYDFEDVTIGTAPANVAGSFEWKKRLDTSSFEVVADPKDANNQVLKLNQAQLNLKLAQAATEVVELNYKIMVGATTTSTQLGEIKVFSSSTGTAGSTFQQIRINNPAEANRIWYYNSQSGQNGWDGYEMLKSGENPVEFKYGEWYDISLRMDVANGTYDLCINGTTVEDLLMPRGEIRNFMFNFNWFGDVDVYFDDMTVRVTPDDPEGTVARGDDQVLFSDCVIERYESKPYGSLAITDMKNAYEPWVTSAQRGVMLTNNRSAFIVRDEVTLKTKSDVYWFSHYEYQNTTGAYVTAEVSSDGKSAIMTDRSGNRMWVGIIDGEGKFEIRDCSFLPGSPKLSETDKAKTKDYSQTHKKLTIKYRGVTEVAVTVAYIPLSRDTSVVAPAEIPNVGTLATWTIPEGEVPSLDTLTLNGVEIKGFEPTKNNYTITVTSEEGIPQVAATSSNGTVSAITQATTECPVASFTVTKADGTSTKFTINFNVRDVLKKLVQGYEITEDNISVSQIKQASCPPKMVIDGKVGADSRWVSQGLGHWLQIDFGGVKKFSQLDIAMYNSDGDPVRTYNLEILVSENGEEWTTVYEGPDLDTVNGVDTQDMVTYTFGGEYLARYIKIVVSGYPEYPGADPTKVYNNIAEIG